LEIDWKYTAFSRQYRKGTQSIKKGIFLNLLANKSNWLNNLSVTRIYLDARIEKLLGTEGKYFLFLFSVTTSNVLCMELTTRKARTHKGLSIF